MSVIDQNSGWLHQNGRESRGAFPGSDAGHPGPATIEEDHGRYVDQVFREEHGGSHIDFEIGAFEAARGVQSEPFWIDEGANPSEEPAMVGGQRRVVETPVLEIVKVPLGDGQVACDLHPMSLSLEVAVHRRRLIACEWILVSNGCSA